MSHLGPAVPVSVPKLLLVVVTAVAAHSRVYLSVVSAFVYDVGPAAILVAVVVVI